MRKPMKSPDTHVNLTPVLGLVAILIPMLLMAYAPQVLAVIDSEPPALCAANCSGGDASEVVTPTVKVTAKGMVLTDVVMAPGAGVTTTELPCAGRCRSADDYDWKGLQDALSRTREETEGTGEVAIIPTDDVAYDVLVETMDACRERVYADGTREDLYPRPILGAAG